MNTLCRPGFGLCPGIFLAFLPGEMVFMIYEYSNFTCESLLLLNNKSFVLIVKVIKIFVENGLNMI